MSQFTSVNLKNIRIIVNKGIHYRQFHSETPLKATVAIQTKVIIVVSGCVKI